MLNPPPRNNLRVLSEGPVKVLRVNVVTLRVSVPEFLSLEPFDSLCGVLHLSTLTIPFFFVGHIFLPLSKCI